MDGEFKIGRAGVWTAVDGVRPKGRRRAGGTIPSQLAPGSPQNIMLKTRAKTRALTDGARMDEVNTRLFGSSRPTPVVMRAGVVLGFTERNEWNRPRPTPPISFLFSVPPFSLPLSIFRICQHQHGQGFLVRCGVRARAVPPAPHDPIQPLITAEGRVVDWGFPAGVVDMAAQTPPGGLRILSTTQQERNREAERELAGVETAVSLGVLSSHGVLFLGAQQRMAVRARALG